MTMSFREQFKKLVYNKKYVDSSEGEPIAEWELSMWKPFFLLLAVFIGLMVLYAYLATGNPRNFMGNMVFYGIVTVGAVAVLWLLGHTIYRGRKFIAGFFIAFILVLTFYWFLGTLLGYFDILNFYMGGWSLWFLITVLAMYGSARMDQHLDRGDVGFAFLVFIVCIGANIPVANGHGFLWNLDNIIGYVLQWSNVASNFLGLVL